MKPTVSDTRSSRRSGSRTLRTSGSSVTKSASDATASIAGERVEERRLAGVGVADERDRRHGTLLTPLAQLRAAAANDVDLLRQHADALPNAPAIGLELGLAGASRPDAAAQPRQRLARSDEPRQEILQLRELDLQLPFPRARAAREDVEDELRAVDDLAAERLLEIAQLRRAQLVVEDDDVDAQFVARRGQRLHFAAAEERRRVGPRALLQHAQDDGRAGGRGEAGKLVERVFRIDLAGRAAREIEESDERGTFVPIGGSRALNRLRRRLRRASTRALGSGVGPVSASLERF